MKKLLGTTIAVAAMAIPGLAQLKPAPQTATVQNVAYQFDRDHDARRGNYNHVLAPEWQSKFDSYYQRWMQYRSTNNRDQMNSMAERMYSIMDNYHIPRNVPFGEVASNGYGNNGYYGRGDHDRDDYRHGDHDRDDYNRNGGYAQSRLSPSDQQKFDSYYQRWLQYRSTNNRDEMNSMQDRMWSLYSQYNIPRNVPFDQVANGGYRR